MVYEESKIDMFELRLYQLMEIINEGIESVELDYENDTAIVKYKGAVMQIALGCSDMVGIVRSVMTGVFG
jgi:hypothetical protein